MSDLKPLVNASTLPIGIEDFERIVPQPADKSRIVLLVYHRNGVEAVPLARGQTVIIGRDAPADVVIHDRGLSRRHARFSRLDPTTIEVEDLGSTNGTKIGGERVERARVKPGDKVMLGAIAVAVHTLAVDDAAHLGLEGHDAFISALEAEIERARFFGRRVAVLVAQSSARDRGLLPRWCPSVRQLLRPVDRIGLYGASVVEMLVPETSHDEALAFARAVVAPRDGEPSLVCGVALFPDAGASAEELVAAARDASLAANASEPVREAENKVLRTVLESSQSRASGDDAEIVMRSPSMHSLASTATRVAKSSIPVLLHGETGSGKEVLARFIHGSGPRRGKPLVCVNCGAIPAQLVESTLFGHERGAFTGALQQQKGVFEAADGGTVLLDEVGELPALAQAALLRVLETRRVTRVGSVRELDVDVRVIAATHRDLEALSETGGFRLDLFYRLSAMVLVIPPLRARRDDIAPLAARFLAQAAAASGRDTMALDPEAMTLLERHTWPGNVRELRNAIERAVVVADGDTVTPRDLPERLRARASSGTMPPPRPAGGGYTGTFKERLESFERETIMSVLRETDGHQTEAARLLDIPLRTLQYKVKSYGLKKNYAPGEEG